MKSEKYIGLASDGLLDKAHWIITYMVRNKEYSITTIDYEPYGSFHDEFYRGRKMKTSFNALRAVLKSCFHFDYLGRYTLGLSRYQTGDGSNARYCYAYELTERGRQKAKELIDLDEAASSAE